jgi:hypothetical protein
MWVLYVSDLAPSTGKEWFHWLSFVFWDTDASLAGMRNFAAPSQTAHEVGFKIFERFVYDGLLHPRDATSSWGHGYGDDHARRRRRKLCFGFQWLLNPAWVFPAAPSRFHAMIPDRLAEWRQVSFSM